MPSSTEIGDRTACDILHPLAAPNTAAYASPVIWVWRGDVILECFRRTRLNPSKQGPGKSKRRAFFAKQSDCATKVVWMLWTQGFLWARSSSLKTKADSRRVDKVPDVSNGGSQSLGSTKGTWDHSKRTPRIPQAVYAELQTSWCPPAPW